MTKRYRTNISDCKFCDFFYEFLLTFLNSTIIIRARKVIRMENNKGILGRLLVILGAVLVTAGVFAFQGLSKAEDTETPGNGGGVGVVVDVDDDDDATDDDAGDAGDNGNGEAAGNTVSAAEVFDYSVKYYTVDETADAETGEVTKNYTQVDAQSYTGVEAGHTFEVVETEPMGVGDFLGWYKKDAEKKGEYLKAGDEVVLTAEKPELELVAKFAVLENYKLKYNANGGAGAPSAEVCQSYFGECDFTIANAVPTREGYEFKGWAKGEDYNKVYLAGSTITNDSADEPLVLYAVWAEIKTYTLMYDVNGGSGSPEVQACKSASGSCVFVITDIVPSKSSATFTGWKRGTETYTAGMEIIVTETNTILLAEWNPIFTIVLSYISDGEVEGLPESQRCETTMGTCTFIVSSKEPTRKGFEFKGWRFEDKEDMLAKSGDELVTDATAGLDLKVKAVWSKIYAILNSGEVFGAGERVVLRSSAGFGNFAGFSIDSQEVPAEYFALSESETTSIVLSNAFAQSLSSGEHAFEIMWGDGKANGIISVSQSEDGTKRFVIVDALGSTDAAGLMYRPKAGAVSKESTNAATDAAADNEEANFDAVRTLIIVAVVGFAVVYGINRFYVHHKMNFIEEY